MSIAERIQASNPGAVDRARSVLASGGNAILQFAEPSYTRELLADINALCSEFGERLEVRFYGHEVLEFDFDVLHALPDVANLTTNYLRQARNVEALSDLRQLRRLSFGVDEYQSSDLLDLLEPSSIKALVLDENAKRNFDLGRLAEFEALESLLVVGHTKGIESMSRLPSLTQLRLRCISKKQGLRFVGSIPRLRFLEIILGGRNDILEIESQSLEELQIIRVRGFMQFPDLAGLSALRSLQIEDQLRLTEVVIPSGCMSKLTKLVINNCKKLSKVEGLARLQSLEHLRFYGTALDLERLIGSGLPGSLRIFKFYSGRAREHAEARELLDSLGYE